MRSLSYDLRNISRPSREALEASLLRLGRILVNIFDDIFDRFSKTALEELTSAFS